MERSPRVAVDWLSRLMAFVSLFAAAGAIGFLFANNGPTQLSSEDFKSKVTEILDERRTADNESIRTTVDTAIQKHLDDQKSNLLTAVFSRNLVSPESSMKTLLII